MTETVESGAKMIAYPIELLFFILLRVEPELSLSHTLKAENGTRGDRATAFVAELVSRSPR